MSDEGIDQVRSQLDTATKELKKVQADYEKLASENKLLLAQNAFRDAELNPSLAKLYVASDPAADISVDAAKAFAEAYGVTGAPAAPAAPTVDAPAQTPTPSGDPSLQALGNAGSRGGEGSQPGAGSKTYTAQEWQELARTDKVAAEKAVVEGRVKFSDQNGWNRDPVNQTGNNPFAARQQEAQAQS